MEMLSVLRTVLREVITRECSQRVNEPDLVMDDQDKVEAFVRAGAEDGVMAPIYLFHCAQICDVIKTGDTVVDMGCGPAILLAMVARLNPDARFYGLDLSPEMLKKAQSCVSDQGINNVSFRVQDITDLSSFEDHSVDTVISTLTLHHLNDFAALEKVFKEIDRVLKPGGGLYMVDFGRLKSEKSMEFYAYQYADQQPELYTQDYINSLRAAFTKNDFSILKDRYLKGKASLYSTFLLPFNVAIKSPTRSTPSSDMVREIQKIKSKLPSDQERVLSIVSQSFQKGGMHSPLLQ